MSSVQTGDRQIGFFRYGGCNGADVEAGKFSTAAVSYLSQEQDIIDAVRVERAMLAAA